MLMKHITMEEWIDFVNHVVSQEQQAAMQKHLGTACKRCMENNGSVAKNSQHGGAGSQLSASRGGGSNRQSGVRGSRSSHARGGEARFRPSALRQFFAAVGGGRRSGGVGTRQMLYRADPYQIDVQIEAKPGGNGLMVTGQLLDVSSPGVVGRDVEITLSDHRGNFIHYDDESSMASFAARSKALAIGAFVSRQERKIHRDLAEKCAGNLPVTRHDRRAPHRNFPVFARRYESTKGG